MVTLFQDLRFALRQLRRSPVFAVVAILSLACGIGANTGIFSLVHQLILRPLPIRDPQSVVLLAGIGRHYGSNNGRNALSYPMYQDLRDQNQVFSGMMCRYSMPVQVGVSGQVEMVMAEFTSGNYFPMLGIAAARGRVFSASDDLHPNAHPLVVLSYAYWKARYALDPAVIGRTIRVNNVALTVVGVANPGFDGMEPGLPTQVFIPMTMTGALRPSFTSMYERRQRWVNVFGRLKSGVSVQQAKAGLQPLFHQILNMEVVMPAFRNASVWSREQFLKMSLDVLPGSQGNTFLRRTWEKPLWILTAVVGLVLLIACANLAALLTARAVARQKEIAIRLALGSGRFRLIRQLFTEAMLLALMGAAAGLGLAVLMIKGLLGFLPINVSGYNISGTPSFQALLFTLGISVMAAMLFGLLPAAQFSRLNIVSALRDQSGAAQTESKIGLRKFLVAAQVALSLVLLIGAGLFIRSLANLRDLDPGFHNTGLIQFSINPRFAGYSADQADRFFRQLDDRLHSLPGVRAAGMADLAILANNEWDSWVAVEGYRPAPGEIPDPHFNAVTPGYFDTLGIHLLSGRNFALRDDMSALKVAIVNEAFQKRYFGHVPAVGHHIGLGGDPGAKTDIEIIGVVNNTRYESLRDNIPEQVFLPELQRPAYGARVVYVATDRDPASAFAAVRALVRDLDPGIPLTYVKTLERQIAESLLTERLIASLSSGFGLLATGLVLVGLYGMMSFTVVRRSREIGIRMALGALARNIVWLIMREAFAVVSAGILIGVPAAWALSRVVRAQLYGIDPADPVSVVSAAVLLAAVTGAAAFLPARRAAGFEPLKVLRYE